MQSDLFDNEFNLILDSSSYKDFADRLRAYDCRRCSLCESRTKIVVDRGNPLAKVMAISERPGTNEDSTGLAFVGRAGELLDKIFSSIGLDSNRDVLIANVVKCLPPFDRAPRADEAEACLPFLDKQIELVRPKVTLLLGAVALKWISRGTIDLPMEEAAGQFFTLAQYPETEFQVLYHPAFLLRDPRKKQPTWDHVQLLKKKIMSEVY